MKVINSYKWFVNLELEDITKKNCSDLLDLIKEKKNIKPNTVQKYKQTLSSAFIFVNDKLAREINNPTIGIKLGHETTKNASELKKTENILRGSDIDVLIKRITETKEYRFQVFIKTVLGTALRRGEIMGLEWKKIRFKDNYIEVYNTMIEYEGSWLLTDYTKNKTHRIVPLFPSIKKMLEEYQEYCKQEEYGVYEDEEGNKYDFVFSKKNGEPYKVNRYSKILTAVVKELNKEGLLIPKPALHDLRGTAITRFLIDRNISLPLVQKLAGHTDPTVTLSYYVNVVDKDIINLSTKYDIED
ncbi:tyrosine-type recombinase/integrase [Vagococcus salmoninarum]|uniref:tyrosine-type recombinase/integrase n=1 Tax=Vagococcus salmoninarum TaxID=2739 RepID=UPI00187DF036|nr:site-specific integrase [Vagococcus salmoninarum]MBE9389646.1 site-specific integrase [Vagococcus salmoninarum]